MMQRWLSWFAVTVLVAVTAAATDLRPPAAPLVACDPYFSIWSMADRLTDDVTRHWTGTPHPLGGLARIDGKPFRMIGNEPPQVPAMEQRSLRVLPTRTIYEFEAGGVGIQLTFMTPALAGDLELLARPVTYITWTAHSSDGQPHDVSLYFDAAALIAVNTPEQEVAASRYQLGSLTVLRAGSQEQPILKKSGDNLRIDWGYLYAVTPPAAGGREVIGSRRGTLNAFAENRPMADADDLSTPRPASPEAWCWPTSSTSAALPRRPCRATWCWPTTTSIRSNTFIVGCGRTGGGTAGRRASCWKTPCAITIR